MSRTFLLLAALCCTLVFSACESDEIGNESEGKYDYELVQTGYHYVETDSALGAVPFYSTVCTVADTDYIAINNLNRNLIELYPILGGQKRSIPVDEVAFGTLKSFFIQSWDSVFIYVRGPRSLHPDRDKELYIINSEGELLSPLPYADQLHLFDSRLEKQDDFAETIMSNQWDPISYSGSRLVFGLLPYNKKENLTRKHFSAEIDIVSGKLSYHPIYIDTYSASSLTVYQSPIKHVDIRNRRILFGLRGTPTLQVLDLGSAADAKTQLHTIPSDFLPLQQPPTQQEIAESPANKSMLQVLSNWGEYGKILQSPDDFYLRFVYYGKQDSIFRATYGNGKTPGVNNRLCSVVLFDKNFQKRGESGTFEGLVDKNAGFSKDGTLYVLDYNSDDRDGKRIRYAKFKIQEIKPIQNES